MNCLISTHRVRDSLKGKTILLTGSTGFLAKVFLEKILRTFPDIGEIYLLIRAADGAHSAARAENSVFSSDLFDFCKHTQGSKFYDRVRNHIRFIAGDTSEHRLGLSDADYLKLSAKVDFVVNSAASTDFMNRLDSAVLTNTLAVKNIAKFVEHSQKARLLHVSTCYVNENIEGVVEEKMYGEGNIAAIIKKLEDAVANQKGGDEAHISLGWKLARSYGWNNIYTFSKWLGENLLRQSEKKIMATIIRPSIVESCLFGPTEGWIEGWKVGDPILYALARNKLRAFPARRSTVMDFIPVDLVANAMLIGLHELGQRSEVGIRIYQSSSGYDNPVTVDWFSRVLTGCLDRSSAPKPTFIFPLALWNVAEVVIRNLGVHRFLGAGWKKLAMIMNTYAPYTSFKSVFQNRELVRLHADLSAEDRSDFPVSVNGMSWNDYFLNIHIPGLKRHVLKVKTVTPLQMRRAQ